MAVAHLILTHSAPDQLARLVRALRHPEARFFIHVDKKTDIRPFKEQVSGEDVTFVSRRVKVCWGGYSMVQATLNGFNAVLQASIPFTHINLLSGQDYPLVPPAAIHQFLESHPRQNFMRFLKVDTEWQEAIPRLDRYHLTQYPFPGSTRLAGLMTRLLPARRMPSDMVAVGRSQWFSITGEAARYLVSYLENSPGSITRPTKVQWSMMTFAISTGAREKPAPKR
jgi:hypothetical protein